MLPLRFEGFRKCSTTKLLSWTVSSSSRTLVFAQYLRNSSFVQYQRLQDRTRTQPEKQFLFAALLTHCGTSCQTRLEQRKTMLGACGKTTTFAKATEQFWGPAVLCRGAERVGGTETIRWCRHCEGGTEIDSETSRKAMGGSECPEEGKV